MKNPKISANEFYNQFTGTENYYSYIFGILLTDGVKNVADEEKCFWFLDSIASYQTSQRFQNEDFQVWTIKRIKNEQFNLSASDGNENQLMSATIPFSDFFFEEFTIWKEGNVLLLPSEH
ncbi:DUF6876 family protein [Chryseobacterium aquaticum]|uniref:DUF6876 domain-containing protein n=1 Tax=Chryseobacterium aquaticum subsp. greenlandense TaxID=345663 RepID=A0A101CHM1_9FLAO|nr:DUF6876 family protein [Chryseobacterium aquaticum]KUJ56422.1 hypothetical protein AR686_07625 [Chryseobacterium aquaticum subsp. greenlandense]